MTEVIAAKLAHLQRRLTWLRGLPEVSPEAFAANETLQLAVERALQEAIEACLDLGRHLLAEAGLPLPDTARGVMVALARRGILPAAEPWAEMAAFRNILVHGYDTLDVGIVHAVWRQRLGDLEAFGRAVLAHSDGGDGRQSPDARVPQ